MKHLRILQVFNRIPWPLNDGGNIATYNVTKYLHQAGHRVELACLNTLKHRQDPEVIREVAALHTLPIDTTVTLLGAVKGLFSKEPYNVIRFWSPDFARLLQDVLRNGHFDIVQLEGSYMSLYAEAIRAASKAKIILRSHNLEHQIWDRLALNEKNPLKRWYLRDLARKIRRWELAHLQDYDAILPITSQDEAFYTQHGFSRAILTLNAGVDLANFSPKNPLEANFKIAFLGSLEWMPNVEGLLWFLEFWPKLRALDPRLELHVAGKNPPAQLSDLKVEGMTFHGQVPDAAEFIETCHIFIVPLLSGGGMRLKVIEAMAMGRCVISTAIGAEGIDAKVGEEILIADSPNDWFLVLKSIVTDQDRSMTIAKKAMEAARNRFGLDAVGKSLEAFYTEVLA